MRLNFCLASLSLLVLVACAGTEDPQRPVQTAALEHGLLTDQPAAKKPDTIYIGTGGVTGIYFASGGAICRMVNKGLADHGVGCSVVSTGGSIQNIDTIRIGELDMGVVQSDWQYHGYNGSSAFADDRAFRDLRAVFSIHPEPFTVVARRDSAIDTFDKLRGKRVNVGNLGSGARATMEVLLEAKGWTLGDFSASELKSSLQAEALEEDTIDAIVFTVGHPNGSIQDATTMTDAVLVPVSGPDVDALVEENPYYSKAVITSGMYRGTDRDVETFGVRATLVTSASVPDKYVYTLVKSVFENFDKFKELHPALVDLDKAEMVRASLSAPLHPGAERYYREAGLL